MAFPFTQDYSKSFGRIFTEDEKLQVLCYIRDFIENKSADNVEVFDDSVTYKGSTSLSRGNVFGGPDKGIFNIVNNGVETIITYEIYTRTILIILPIVALAICIISRSIIIPIIFVSCFGGIILLMESASHGDVFDEIIAGIEKLTPPDDKETQIT